MSTRLRRQSCAGGAVLAVVLLAAGAEAAPMHWVYEAAYPAAIAGDYDAVLDEQGHLHIVYGRDALYYDWEDADGWHSEVLDTTAVPASHDLVLDSAGFPHIAYVDLRQYHVKYAQRDADGWSTETLALDACEGNGLEGPLTAICLDSTGRAHVAYNAGAWETVTLKHLVKEASGWQATTVRSWSYGAIEQIAIGAAGDAPRIACAARGGGPFDPTRTLFHARRTTSGWQSAETPNPAGYGEIIMLFDASGLLHVAYRDEDGSGWEGVSYVTIDRGQFVTEDLFRTGNWLGLQLAVSREGVPHLVFGNNVGYEPRGFYHMSKVGAEWEQTLIDEDEQTKYSATLGLDAAGRPHLYYEQTHVWRDDEGWQSTPEPSGPDVERSRDGNPRLLVAGNRLRMVYSFPPGTPNPDGIGAVVYSQDATAWQERVLAQPGGILYSSKLVLDAQNRPHILFSYYDKLLYVWRDVQGWHRASLEVESPGIGPRPAHLALDVGGRPHIGYLSGGDEAFLKYAVPQDTGWSITQFEADTVAMFSMALDSEGRPHIGYRSGDAEPALKYAVLQDTGWSITEVDTDPVVSFSMALDGMEQPHFLAWQSWQSAESGVAVHDWQDQGGWHRESVSPIGSISLTRDRAGNLHTCGALRTGENTSSVLHTLCTPEGWQVTTVDEDRACGYISALSCALDEDNRPHICYATYNPNRLLYAWQDAAGYHVSTVETFPEDVWVDSVRLGLTVAGTSCCAYQLRRLDGRVDLLQYAERGPDGWKTCTIGRGTAFEFSLAVDSQGRPHIAATIEDIPLYLHAPPFALTGLNPLAGGQVRIHWQGALEGVGVDGAASLSGEWSPVAEDLSGLEGELSADPAMRFFRLRQAEAP